MSKGTGVTAAVSLVSVSNGRINFDRGTVSPSEARLAIATDAAVALIPPLLMNGSIAVTAGGTPVFEESFLPTWYVDPEEGKSRSFHNVEAAKEYASKCAEAGKTRHTRWDAPKYISNALVVPTVGEGNQHRDKRAGEIMGELFSRFPRSEELSVKESDQWLKKSLVPDLVEVLPEKHYVGSVVYTIRAEGHVKDVLKNGSVVIHAGGATKLHHQPEGWDTVVKQGDKLCNTSMFNPKSSKAKRGLLGQLRREGVSLEVKVLNQCPWDPCEVEYVLDDGDCPVCGSRPIPTASGLFKLDKSARLIDVEATEAIQSPYEMDYVVRALDTIQRNPMARKLAPIQRQKRAAVMEKAGGVNRVQSLQVMLSM